VKILFPTKTLAEVAKVFSGFAFKSTDLGEDGIPVVKIANIQDKRVLRESAEFFPERLLTPKLERYWLQPDDILVAMTGAGSLGKVGKMRGIGGRYLVNQRVGIVRPDREKVVPEFLYQALSHDDYEKELYGFGLGAGQPNVSPAQVGSVLVPCPPLDTQQKVAGILSAYDDLIENNSRRIRLLQKLAQALYREWFVSFRFPCHAKVNLVDSLVGKIPQGWEVTRLGEHLAALETGKRPKGGAEDVADGVPSIGAENIKGIGQHNFASEKFVSRDFFEQMRKGVIQDRDVAIYKDGAYIGRSSYFRNGFPHHECCVNEHVFLLRSSGPRLTQNMLYLWLQEPDTVHAIRGTNANAAQPGINQQSVHGLGLVIPNTEVAAEFDCVVEPLMAGIVNYAKRNQVLCRTRDLLLPKLISGALDVSELDIEPA
jgi:type I restriction enzyme, S subunit